MLDEGHPVRDAVVGRPDPAVNGSQNPAGYCELDEEKPFVFRPCGCGESTDRDFLAGHDMRAIQARVREHFGGSPLKFIQWVDGAIGFGQAITASAPKPDTDTVLEDGRGVDGGSAAPAA